MGPDHQRCYRAVRSRDRRFDGRFFTAVRTTGIYCRPICPAPTPRPENVRFYRCAAAAEAAGYRPCRRCRPEASPGTPAWSGTSATVSRALRLIAAGALDDGGGTDQLAARLGVGARHLRRLFVRQLGAPPRAVCRSRRTHLARRLLAETRLPMGRVAESAGFPSVRQFNEAIRDTFHATPTDLRRDPQGDGGVGSDAFLSLRLPYRPPLDWKRMIDFLRPRAIPGVESIGAGAYRRIVPAGRSAAVVEVLPDRGADCLHLRLPIPLAPELAGIVERVRSLFDLDADPMPIAAQLRADPVLAAALRRRPGLRIPGCWDRFELGVRAILGQQVTVTGATTLMGRLVERWGTAAAGGDPAGPGRLFPAPEALAGADLASIGIPGGRAEALRRFAARKVRGNLPLDGSAGLEEAVAELTRIPGIGDWTAQYIAMRALGEPDAFPCGDLGLRRAFEEGGKMITPAGLLRRAEAWRPWRAYAAIHLWARPGAAMKKRRGRDVSRGDGEGNRNRPDRAGIS